MNMTKDKSSEGVKQTKVQDLEIKDPNLIFSKVWGKLVAEYGGETNLHFPKEIFWLNGAPGAGKGTHTQFIMEYRDYAGSPIVMSDLLQSQEAQKRKDAGLLASDSEVFALLLRKLLDPEYANGAVVDGFPRTQVQVECLKLFYSRLVALRALVVDTPGEHMFRRPHFHIIVLFIDEEESVKRQLLRGQQVMEKNKEVEASGMGESVELRKTDLEEDAARNRYRVFKEVTYSALQSLQELFHYHYINAVGSIAQVQGRIIEELKYQSSLELSQKTFDRLTRIPIASEIVKHARQQLVYRLDDYEANHNELFEKVVKNIEFKFMPIIHRHAISGKAIVNTEDEIFDEPLALAMLIDVFSERGYHAIIDIKRVEVPESVDAETFKVKNVVKRVYSVQLRFSGSDIRRGR